MGSRVTTVLLPDTAAPTNAGRKGSQAVEMEEMESERMNLDTSSNVDSKAEESVPLTKQNGQEPVEVESAI